MCASDRSQSGVSSELQYLYHGSILVVIKDPARLAFQLESGLFRIIDRFERPSQAVSLERRFAGEW